MNLEHVFYRKKPQIIDLEMSDLEYAQMLVEGHNRIIQEKLHEQVFIEQGLEPIDAKQIAPLIDKHPRSPSEQEIVTKVWQKWCVLRGYL